MLVRVVVSTVDCAKCAHRQSSVGHCSCQTLALLFSLIFIFCLVFLLRRCGIRARYRERVRRHAPRHLYFYPLLFLSLLVLLFLSTAMTTPTTIGRKQRVNYRHHRIERRNPSQRFDLLHVAVNRYVNDVTLGFRLWLFDALTIFIETLCASFRRMCV